MKFVIIGSGGGYFGGRLAASGQEAIFVARGTLLEALNRYGLKKRSTAIDSGYECYTPDVRRIRGVTAWMRAASLVHTHGLELSSHLSPKSKRTCSRSRQRAIGRNTGIGPMGFFKKPFEIKVRHLQIPERPGAGMEWNEEVVRCVQIG